jgi:hypothetical protein
VGRHRFLRGFRGFIGRVNVKGSGLRDKKACFTVFFDVGCIFSLGRTGRFRGFLGVHKGGMMFFLGKCGIFGVELLPGVEGRSETGVSERGGNGLIGF